MLVCVEFVPVVSHHAAHYEESGDGTDAHAGYHHHAHGEQQGFELEYLEKLGENSVMRESGSTAIAKLQSGECAAIMILEESILKYINDEAAKGNEVTNLEIIYPEDGVILVPSTVMIVAEEFSKNVNTEAAEAVADWLLSEEAQKLIMQGYMHSVLADMKEYPEHSIPTDDLIKMDMGIDWEYAYKNREEINNLWTVKVTQ